MPLPARRLQHIPPFLALDMLREANARVARGEPLVRLEAGQPAEGLPLCVREAMAKAVVADPLPYTEAKGQPSFRRAIAAHYREQYGVTVDPDQIIATPGSSGAFILAFLAAFNPGARVGIMQPGYPAYRSILLALDMVPVPIPVGPGSRWQVTPELLAQAGSLDGVMLASPANPTGTMMTPDTLSAVLAFCKAQNIRVVADEIYHGMVYGDVPVSTAAGQDDVIVINSFSKYYAMTGWRLGWLVLPPDLLTGVERLMQSLFIAAPTLAQLAGEQVLRCRPELDARVAAYRDNRDRLQEGLLKWGVQDCAPADGAFYLYADVSPLTDNSFLLCQRLLDGVGVVATSGVDFDPVNGHRFVRFSFAGTGETVVEAVRRLGSLKMGRQAFQMKR